MTKKIGFLVPEIRNCGPVNVVFDIISHLNLKQFNIMLIAVRKKNSDQNLIKSISKKCSLGIIFLDDYKKNNIKYLENTLDIIHSHGFFPDKFVAKLNKNKIKKITTIHSLLFEDYLKEYGFLKGNIGALLHFYYLNTGNFNHIIGCSKTVYLNLLQRIFIAKNQIDFINNGVNQYIYNTLSEDEKAKQRNVLGFSSKEILFIFSGRLIRRKRVPELIEKFNTLKLPNSKLLILGDGEEFSLCQKVASENIIFLGFVKNPELYYKISNFVLSMSSAEGYPLSILEAVSCGCYAFLSDIASHREFIYSYPEKSNFIDNLSIDTLSLRNQTQNDDLSAKKMAEKYTQIYLK